MKRNNIVLIGMPASGKSTLGRELSKKLGWEFVDSDKLIEKVYGKKLKDIIAEVGNDGFLDIEDKINSSISGSNMVISPGGSVVFCQNAMKHFSDMSVIVYLKTSFYVLSKRIGDPVKRGVVLKEGQTIKDVFHDRRKFFEKYAHINFRMKNVPVADSVNKLLFKFEDEGIIIY